MNLFKDGASRRPALLLRFVLSLLAIAVFIGARQGVKLDVIWPSLGNDKCSPPKRLQCAGRDLTGIDLRGLNLIAADFRESDLAGAKLANTNLSSANLHQADLTGANLSGANLTFADLGGTLLQDSRLDDAQIVGANLRLANLTGANLTGANLTGADLYKANLTGARLNALLKDVSFFETTMPDGTLRSDDEEVSQVATSVTTSISPKSARTATSLLCRDGMLEAYCQVMWTDGSTTPLPWFIGPRQGGVVDKVVHYDAGWAPWCIHLYADGSILTFRDLSNCS